MGVPNIDGVVVKVIRAYQHLLEFHGAIANFVDSGPYTVVIKDHLGSKDQAGLVLGMREVPPGISVLVGDFAHNLRSALDQLAWQLVIDAGGTPTAQGDEDPVTGKRLPLTQFPIWTEGRKPSQPGNPPPIPTIYPGITTAAAAIVQRVQPYIILPADPDLQALGGLQRLNNVDKHHQPTVLLGGLIDPSYVVLSPTKGEIVRGTFPGTVKVDTEFVVLPRSDVPNDVYVNFNGLPSVSLDIEGLLLSVTRRDGGLSHLDALSHMLFAVVTDVMLPLIDTMTNRTV